MAKGFKKASRAEIIKVNDRLKEVVDVLETGLCVYKDNHSDESVAKEIGCTAASVAGVRKELFGNLVAKRSSDRIEEVIKLTENLTKSFYELKDRHNKLVMLLALNKVVDCRHLELK